MYKSIAWYFYRIQNNTESTLSNAWGFRLAPKAECTTIVFGVRNRMTCYKSTHRGASSFFKPATFYHQVRYFYRRSKLYPSWLSRIYSWCCFKGTMSVQAPRKHHIKTDVEPSIVWKDKDTPDKPYWILVPRTRALLINRYIYLKVSLWIDSICFGEPYPEVLGAWRPHLVDTRVRSRLHGSTSRLVERQCG